MLAASRRYTVRTVRDQVTGVRIHARIRGLGVAVVGFLSGGWQLYRGGGARLW
jgi:hypothetical protein